MRYVVKNNEDIKKCMRAFNEYYGLLREYIDKGTLKSSLDRGAFTHPSQILNKDIINLLGGDRHRISLGYGQEAGEQILREKIAELENLKHATSYTSDNVVIVAGAWSGVEIVFEELSNIEQGKFKKIKIAVIGPTHYQLFQRPIEVFGSEVVGFDFINFEGSTPRYKSEIDEILAIKPDVIFITNPNNPVGEYFPTDLLKYLIEITKDTQIKLVVDEMQNFLPIEGKSLNYNSWIQSKNVIRIDSFSKHYGLAEYRIGWIICDKNHAGNRYKGFISRVRGFMGNAPRAANDAILSLINLEIGVLRDGKNSPITKKENSLGKKYQYILETLSKNPEIKILPRDACFNLTIQLRGFADNNDVSRRLMEAGTLIMPCEGYGYNSKDLVIRITFAERWKKIKHSLGALNKIISDLKR